ncbi:MAG: hypothetical protein ACPHX8_06885 [Candidatus Poseidoniaceae archaeon]
MTTQAVSVTAGNGSMSKIFTLDATDGQWDGNVLTDSISSQSIGILIPNTTLSYAQGSYEAGCMAWRLQNAQTLIVKARGLGVLNGLECIESDSIQPVQVGQNDILTVFPQPAGGAGTTNSLAWIQTSKSTELFTATGATDLTATNMVSAVNSQSLGDLFFGTTLQRIWIQVQDGGSLDKVEIVDEMGGVVMTLQGGKRGATGGSRSNLYNLYAINLNVRIGKGWNIRTTANSA